MWKEGRWVVYCIALVEEELRRRDWVGGVEETGLGEEELERIDGL